MKILFYNNVENGVAEIFGYHPNAELIPNISDFTYVEIFGEFSFPEQIEGKYSRSFINLDTLEITHEYEDIPKEEPSSETLQIEQNVDFDYRLSLLEMGLA